MKAGFAEIDITPPPGTKKGGWMEDLEARTFLDPLFARVAIFQDESGGKAAFIQLDTLSVRWSDADDLRKRIASACGFPAGNIMVSATHNHAGPAIARLAPVAKATAYVEDLKKKCIAAFAQALSGLEEAAAGFASAKEFDMAFNRRTVMRDGTVKSQTYFAANPDALYMEGPADPEVAVVIVKKKSEAPRGPAVAGRGIFAEPCEAGNAILSSIAAPATEDPPCGKPQGFLAQKGGTILGALVNFACHPTHHGGTHEISAGFPGVLAAKMKA